jgi:hypothetical protein
VPACIHGISPLGVCSICTPPEPRPIEIAGPGGEPLTEAERKYLAMHAHYESGRQDDVRYWDADPEKRLALKRRWREIADWLHSEPWGEQPQQRPAELAGVEDGRITAWNAGHVKSLKVIRVTAGEVPLVDCPECCQPASVDTAGNIRCLTVPGCFGGWRVAVSAVGHLPEASAR